MQERKDYVYVSPVATEYRYYLDSSVTETEDYHQLFELLANAGENDCVRIIISNFGGSLSTCIAIVNAIRACGALTVGVLASVAYSAGGAIWLACEAQEVQQHVGFMAHNAVGGSYGSLYQQKQSIDHEMIMLRSLYEDVYEGFFSVEEIETLLKNDDLWLNEKEICKRLEQRDKYFKDKQEADQKALAELYADMEADLELPPDDKLEKQLTKKQLIALLKGDVDLKYDEASGKIELIAAEE